MRPIIAFINSPKRNHPPVGSRRIVRGEEKPQPQRQRSSFAIANHNTEFPLKVNNRIVAVLRGSVLDIRRTTAGLLRVPPALAIACDVLNLAESMGCREIVATITDTGRVYGISLADFQAHSWPIERGGYEPQKACPLAAFSNQATHSTPALSKVPAQMSLFES